MSLRNRAILVGYVGMDPERKQTESGTIITKFSLGTHESYKNERGEKVQTTDWHNIVTFGKFADLIHKYVKKGSHVHLEGRIKNRSYEKPDGTKGYTTEIIGESIDFLDKKD